MVQGLRRVGKVLPLLLAVAFAPPGAAGPLLPHVDALADAHLVVALPSLLALIPGGPIDISAADQDGKRIVYASADFGVGVALLEDAPVATLGTLPFLAKTRNASVWEHHVRGADLRPTGGVARVAYPQLPLGENETHPALVWAYIGPSGAPAPAASGYYSYPRLFAFSHRVPAYFAIEAGPTVVFAN